MMKNETMEQLLRRELGRGPAPVRLEETVSLCLGQLRQGVDREEPQQSFWGFLADIFRFEGIPILVCQAAALLLVGLHVYGAAEDLGSVPAYIPLFALAALPVLFRGQRCRTSELEAVTCASGAQIVLAKLLLAAAADLVCLTLLLAMEVRLTGSWRQLGQMILYCLVPYLASMSVTLRLIRRRQDHGMALGAAAALGSGLFWYGSAKLWPWLYEISAAGVWLAAFILFTAFFVREIHFIVRADREGKMYGIVA